MNYDKSTIMQTAWARTRDLIGSGYTASQLRSVFASCLREAWRLAKNAARDAAMTIDQVLMAILDLENRTRLSLAGQERLSQLQSLLFQKRAVADREAKRSIIEDAGSQFVAVTFIRQDGSLRRMNIQPAALKSHVKGADASPAGQKAAATRKARHPASDAGLGRRESCDPFHQPCHRPEHYRWRPDPHLCLRKQT